MRLSLPQGVFEPGAPVRLIMSRATRLPPPLTSRNEFIIDRPRTGIKNGGLLVERAVSTYFLPEHHGRIHRAKLDKTRVMKREKLYLTCPDCHIEQTLRNEFGQEICILTALGSVFDFSKFDYAETLNHFLDREMISEIVIVNDVDCTFIRNTICKGNNHNTKAEQELSKLKKNNSERFAHLETDKQKELLARLNIYRQAYELLNVAFVGGKIDDGYLSTSGLIYNRDTFKFERLILEL